MLYSNYRLSTRGLVRSIYYGFILSGAVILNAASDVAYFFEATPSLPDIFTSLSVIAIVAAGLLLVFTVPNVNGRAKIYLGASFPLAIIALTLGLSVYVKLIFGGVLFIMHADFLRQIRAERGRKQLL